MFEKEVNFREFAKKKITFYSTEYKRPNFELKSIL